MSSNSHYGNITWFVVSPCLEDGSFYVLSKLPHEQVFFMASERRIEQKSTAQSRPTRFLPYYRELYKFHAENC